MVALVEAMKVFNEIHVDVSGVIEDILVAGGQAVQAGQTLMTLRPDPPTPYGDSLLPLAPLNSSDSAPQVSPPPKPERRTVSLGLMRPLSTASQRAIGMEAAEVFP